MNQPHETNHREGYENIIRRNLRIIDSQFLFHSNTEIGIRHNEQLYRLRKTRNGKLILYK
jgi:hemin uptake protein HemP